jgi:predicted TIM-barrel fold metal-dependent hydrolase
VNLRYGLISADDHVQEHPEVWTSRLSKAKWGERIPHVARDADGIDRWLVDGSPVSLTGVSSPGALLANRAGTIQCWEEVPSAAYLPTERLKMMDADGVDYSVLYPSVAGVGGETLARIADPELARDCARAYNDWLIDEWASVSPRFVPQCIVPVAPLEATVEEIRRAVQRGHRGVVFPVAPMELQKVPHINEPAYDAVWEICEKLGVPVCFHAGGRPTYPIYDGFAPAIAASAAAVARSASTIFVLVNFLISRILTRHASLKVVFAESRLGWATYILEYADYQVEKDHLPSEGYDLKPSELFHRHCYLTGWYDRAAVQTLDVIGAANVLWSTNFPQATSTWPESQRYLNGSLQGVADTDRARVAWRNAAELYRL